MSRLRLKQLAQDGATTGQAVVFDGTHWGPGSVGATLTVQDENTNVSTTVTQMDFQGAGVTVTPGTGEVVVTIPGASGSYSRATAAVTTASLANGSAAQTTVPLAVSYRLLRLQTDVPARVRLYTTAAKQAADLSRAAGTDPTGDSGLVLDFVTTASVLSADLSPQVDGSDLESTPSTSIPMTVTNLSGSTAAVTVTLTFLRTE